MKLKLKDLNPNPFKKEIDGGKLNKEQVAKIKSSIKDLGLMGTLPVVKIKNKYHLVSHHHRTQALKELGYKEVEVTIQKYSQEQLLRGMVMENLTQRTDDFKEIVQNLKCAKSYLMSEKYLKSKEAKDDPFLAVQSLDSKKPQHQPVAGSIRHVEWWINRYGEIIKKSSVDDHLQVADNLSPKLYAKVEKTHSGDADRRTNGEVISQSQAIMLAKIKDKDEQEDLEKALHNSRENRVRDQSKIITQYKQAKPEVKKAIREGKKDIADVSVPVVFQPRKKSEFEFNTDCAVTLSSIDMEKWKKSMKGISLIELESVYSLLIHWCHEDLTPLIKEIIKEVAKRKNEAEDIVFEINTTTNKLL